MKLSETKLNEILQLIKDKKDYKHIAKYFNIKESTARRYIRFVKSNIEIEDNNQLPKILLLDIETLPMEIFVWALYKQRPSYDQMIKDWSIVTWSAKWLYDNSIFSASVTPEEATARNDKRILKPLWNLLEECDVCIGHNVVRFDNRKINARFIINEYNRPVPYQMIDTLKHAQKVGAFSSHKLNDLCKMLDKESKIKTDYELWKRASGVYKDKKDQQKAIQEMLTYNENDVLILEDLYLELRPWMVSHPNVGLFSDVEESLCPACGSDNLYWKGDYCTTVGRFETFRCEECKSIGRSRSSKLTKEKRKSLTVSVAR